MYTTLEPVQALTAHPQVRRHLTTAERASLRFAVWLLTRHLRRAAALDHRDLARRCFENERARGHRGVDTLHLAQWHLGAR